MTTQWRNSIWFRRGAFVMVNAAAFAGFLILFAWPIQAFFAAREAQISERHALLSRLDAIVAQRSTVESLATQAASDGDRTEFLQGANEGVATANLQTLLKGMVEPSGARLRSVRALPARAINDVKFIGAQLEMTGTIQAVYQTIRAVEAGKPFLFVTSAVLRPTQQAPTQPNGSVVESTIDAELDVLGAMQAARAK